MEIVNLKISWEELENMPEKERLVFVHLTHAANELIILLRLLTIVDKTEQPGPERDGHATQVMFLLKIAAGKSFETWELIKQELLGSSDGKEILAKLSNTGREQVKFLKQYFGQKNIISKVRNEYAFHYDQNSIREFLASVSGSKDFHIYLGESRTATLYFLAEEIIASTMLKQISEGDKTKAFEKFWDETTQITDSLLLLIDQLTIVILKDSFPKIKKGKLNIPDITCDDLQLPYFVTVDTKV